MSKLFHKQCTQKASGHGNISKSTLKNCAHQTAALFIYIYISSLRQCRVLVCFKMSTIIPIPNKCNIDREMHAESLEPGINVFTHTLKNCDNQLVAVFTDIYNSCLRQCRVSVCFKVSTIIPIPKTFQLKQYRPVALTLVAMKMFQRLVLRYLNTATDGLLDSHQFAYQRDRLVDNVTTLGLHHI